MSLYGSGPYGAGLYGVSEGLGTAGTTYARQVALYGHIWRVG